MGKGPNIEKWRDWRLCSIIAEEAQDKEKENKDAEEIGPGSAEKVAKPPTDNEGKREVVAINGKRFHLDADSATGKTGHTFTWVEIEALYDYGKKEKYF